MHAASETLLTVPRLSRPEVIARLRTRLEELTRDRHCVCEVAGQLGIFCRGFAALSDAEFRERFDWLVRRFPAEPRSRLEELASLYHEGRREATGAEICCDVETRERIGCDGWNRFDNVRLSQFHLTLLGSPVRID